MVIILLLILYYTKWQKNQNFLMFYVSKLMKNYIKQLEEKIKKLSEEKMYIPVHPPDDKMVPPPDTKPVEGIENISLEIVEN